ncbi:hypothetical protein HII36_23125 [Nonomuraea sp. NN258]|uniref:hypothetical protein n=1 Tax=Nonomuraea antri TaxID=2730852 RepID=UPI001569C4D7|nr:hypothetical protein [Nonomuraea antri]NRQ34702.1 hypothetical protein [Nonomuraea antri]
MISTAGSELGKRAAHRLAQTGLWQIEPGLTDTELARIEHEYGFEFSDDHRAFLAAGLPTGSPPHEPGVSRSATPWPDWRNGDPEELRHRLNGPVDGVLWDVEHGYWHRTWGERPNDQAEAMSTAGRELAEVPRMIPIFSHRYLPAGRGTFGHPVLSMVQTDIIYYGTDLADYIHKEFGDASYSIDPHWAPPTVAPFWRDFL